MKTPYFVEFPIYRVYFLHVPSLPPVLNLVGTKTLIGHLISDKRLFFRLAIINNIQPFDCFDTR